MIRFGFPVVTQNTVVNTLEEGPRIKCCIQGSKLFRVYVPSALTLTTPAFCSQSTCVLPRMILTINSLNQTVFVTETSVFSTGK
jgi:hypothetical protein